MTPCRRISINESSTRALAVHDLKSHHRILQEQNQQASGESNQYMESLLSGSFWRDCKIVHVIRGRPMWSWNGCGLRELLTQTTICTQNSERGGPTKPRRDSIFSLGALCETQHEILRCFPFITKPATPSVKITMLLGSGTPTGIGDCRTVNELMPSGTSTVK